MNKVLKVFLILLLTTITLTGITYASSIIIKNVQNKLKSYEIEEVKVDEPVSNSEAIAGEIVFKSFYITNDENKIELDNWQSDDNGLYYKKVSNYMEYKELMDSYSNLRPLVESDFENYFAVIIVSDDTTKTLQYKYITYDNDGENETMQINISYEENENQDDLQYSGLVVIMTNRHLDYIFSSKIVSDSEEDTIQSEIYYNYAYGEVSEIDNNTIIYYDEGVYLSQEIPENCKVIDFETEETITVNDIDVGDYVTFYIPTEESENAQAIIIVAKKDYIVEEIENQLLYKKEFNAELVYYNEIENYIIVEISLDRKVFDSRGAQPVYYLNLNVDDTTGTYLGYKENNSNSNYGYQIHELCTIELKSEITNLQNEYLVEAIEFIAD